MSKREDVCAIKDQFCTGEAVAKCRFCGDAICAACSVETACHRCLRGLGSTFTEVVSKHLDALGGKVKRPKRGRPWGSFKV